MFSYTPGYIIITFFTVVLKTSAYLEHIYMLNSDKCTMLWFFFHIFELNVSITFQDKPT